LRISLSFAIPALLKKLLTPGVVVVKFNRRAVEFVGVEGVPGYLRGANPASNPGSAW
jgi:hypothetical protein